MSVIDSTLFKKLQTPDARSHKGQNGRVLVIAGSEKFHGALLMCIETVSRVVDMVHVYTDPANVSLIENLKSAISTCIVVRKQDIEKTIEAVDVVIVGPGMETTDDSGEERAEETRAFVHDLLANHQDKKFVVDATALWHVNLDCLHENCILTPHSREFTHVFGMEPNAENTKKAAATFGGIVVLKGATDYISDGNTVAENTTGNVGMTKGGTGDALAGLIGGLATTNELFLAAQAGTHLLGLAGDSLHKKVGTFYNTQDVIEELGAVWKEYIHI